MKVANEEPLEILKQGVDVWNKWRVDNPGVKPCVAGHDLHDLNLQERRHPHFINCPTSRRVKLPCWCWPYRSELAIGHDPETAGCEEKEDTHDSSLPQPIYKNSRSWGWSFQLALYYLNDSMNQQWVRALF